MAGVIGTVVAAAERAYRRPPLSWTVTWFGWLERLMRRLLRPLLYRYAMRRVSRLTELVAALTVAGHHREATQIAALAVRWRRIAEGVQAGRRR